MSLWDSQQREWLQAMGHSLLVLAGDEAGGDDARAGTQEREGTRAAERGEVEKHAPAPEHPAVVAAQSQARRVPPTAAPVADEPVPAALPARQRTDPASKAAALAAARRAGAARNASGPLGEALLRATGRPPAAAARMLRELQVDQAALRDDPGAKRSLWRRLRPLRKGIAK